MQRLRRVSLAFTHAVLLTIWSTGWLSVPRLKKLSVLLLAIVVSRGMPIAVKDSVLSRIKRVHFVVKEIWARASLFMFTGVVSAFCAGWLLW